MGQTSRTHPFDFDQWHSLARSDPASFESRRREVIAAAIARAPHAQQERLRCLQWRIDHIRARSATPLAACLKLVDMMWESTLGDDGLLATLHAPQSRLQRPAARILTFPRR